MYGNGISKEGEIVDLGVRADVIKKSGAWFSYGDRRLAQGRDKVKDLIKNDPELAAELEAKIMANIDNLAPISKSSKYAKGKSKKEAIAEAVAEAEGAASVDDEESFAETQPDISEVSPEGDAKPAGRKKKSLDIDGD